MGLQTGGGGIVSGLKRFELRFSSVDQNTFFMYWLLLNFEIHTTSNSFYFEQEGGMTIGELIIGRNILFTGG